VDGESCAVQGEKADGLSFEVSITKLVPTFRVVLLHCDYESNELLFSGVIDG
jgi:hypothetical protein